MSIIQGIKMHELPETYEVFEEDAFLINQNNEAKIIRNSNLKLGTEGPKGEKGDPFTFDDFTPEQLEELRGPAGISGDTVRYGTDIENSEEMKLFLKDNGNDSVIFQLLDYDTEDVIRDLKVIAGADCVTFDDGDTFQDKLNNGTLIGQNGIDGKSVELRKKDNLIQWRYIDVTQGLDANWRILCILDDLRGQDGEAGKNGTDGMSAYDVYAQNAGGNPMSEIEWLESLRGSKGETGEAGPAGEPGPPFKIAKIYSSVEEMNNDFSNNDVEETQFVLINTNSIEDPDNAKLYIKSATEYSFVSDLSGATGIQGTKGEKGEKGEPGDLIRIGSTFDSAAQTKVFFKLI